MTQSITVKQIQTKNDKTENVDVQNDKKVNTDQLAKPEVETSSSNEIEEVKNEVKADIKDDSENVNNNSSVEDDQLVTILEKSDDSNFIQNPLSPPLSPKLVTNAQGNISPTTTTTKSTTAVVSTTEIPTTDLGVPIELKIVEQNDELTKSGSKEEVSPDNNEATKSNHSLQSVQQMQLDKHSSQLDNKYKGTKNLPIETKTDIQEANITNPSTKDNLLRDCIVDNAEEVCENMDNSHLDINKNEPDVKLKYAKVNIEDVLDSQICENTEYETAVANVSEINNKSNELSDDSTIKNVTDLDEKVQNENCGDVLKNKINIVNKKEQQNQQKQQLQHADVTEPKLIQAKNPHQSDENDDDNMSPICSTRPPLNSPRLKTKDMLNELPLTPDSSHSLDSSCEFSNSFEIKTFTAPSIPERSFSSESLNSETSVDSNDSKSSIKLAEAKFSKNGTLERQNSNGPAPPPPTSQPTGLQVLMLWNNQITRASARQISELLSVTTTLEILNVGKNVLGNDFVTNVKQSLKTNVSLISLGLQSAHLSNEGIKTLSEVLDFGGNVTLQRIDLRDNNLQVSGLTSLNEVLKSNKSIRRYVTHSLVLVKFTEE